MTSLPVFDDVNIFECFKSFQIISTFICPHQTETEKIVKLGDYEVTSETTE